VSDIANNIKLYRDALGLSRAQFAEVLGEKPSKIQDIETGKQRINDIFITNLIEKYPIDLEWLFKNKGSSGRILDAGSLYRSINTKDSELRERVLHAQLGVTVAKASTITPDKTSEFTPNPKNTVSEIEGNGGISDLGNSEFIQIKRFDVEASAGHGVHVTTEASSGRYSFNRKWLERRGLKENHLSVISIRGDSMEPDLYDHDLILMDEAQTALKDGHIYVVHYSDGLYVKRIQFLPDGQIHLTSRNISYPPIAVKHPEADGLNIIGRVVASMHEW